MKKAIAMLIALTLVCGLFAGCGEKANEIVTPNATAATEGSAAAAVEADFSKTDEDMFTDRDLRSSYEEGDSILIELQGDSAAASAGSVKISGSTVTLTEDKTHIISGTLNNGMIIVDAPDTAKLQLVLNGVSIHSETSAALYILEADKVFVTLAEGTQNSLSNGGTFTAIDENNIDGAVFSRQDLTLNGTGALTVTSPASHGIVCKDDLVITGGSYTVNAASHGLDANDSVRVCNANITVDAGKDGIHAENTDDAALGYVYVSNGALQIEAEGDGIAAGAYLQIEDGDVNVLAGGGSVNGTKASSDSFGGFMGGGRPMQPGASVTTEESSTSMKGLKAGSGMQISGGTFSVDSADDCLHSNASMIINGGVFQLASGDDGIHAEDTLTVTGGQIDISESYEGLEALHIDIQSGDIKLVASDDGLNAAGGVDASGTTGGRDGMFGGGGMGGGRPGGMGGGRPGGMGGGMGGSSNGSIQISGGTLYVNASGDGIDANGTLTISGGHTTVVGPTRGDTATLDYDTSATITGGTFIGTGAAGMAQTFSESQQGVIAVSVGNQTEGTQVTLTDADGNTVVSFAPELSFAVVILSSPEIVKGETYTICVGTETGDVQAG